MKINFLFDSGEEIRLETEGISRGGVDYIDLFARQPWGESETSKAFLASIRLGAVPYDNRKMKWVCEAIIKDCDYIFNHTFSKPSDGDT